MLVVLEKKHSIPDYVADDLIRILSVPDSSVKKDGCEYDDEVVFADGFRMAIQVCSSTQPSIEPCWTQGVLFDPDGFEVGFTEPGESLLGEYTVQHQDTLYRVVVDKQETRNAASEN
jgi:hypothetical protein